jgi:hypothetical protein
VGATDHASFDDVGLPGFQFIQERLEYNSRSHHSNMDTFDRVPKADVEPPGAVALDHETWIARPPSGIHGAGGLGRAFEVALVAVFHAQQLGAIGLEAAGLHPQLGRSI